MLCLTLYPGRYLHGIPTGTWWQVFPYGGFLMGEVSEVAGLSLTGNSLLYLYPDLVTALRGKFDQSRMVKSKLSRVEAVWVEKGICEIR